MRSSSICRRCHRIRAVDQTRCCQACATALRAMEKRRAITIPAPEAPEDVLPFEGESATESTPETRNGLVFLPDAPEQPIAAD